MAGKQFDRDSEEFKFFAEYYKFVQKYYIPENTDPYWDDMLAEANLMYQKYHIDYCREIIMATIGFLERKGKSGEG